MGKFIPVLSEYHKYIQQSIIHRTIAEMKRAAGYMAMMGFRSGREIECNLNKNIYKLLYS